MGDVVISIQDELLPTYRRFQKEHGTNWASRLIEEKLVEIVQRHLNEDRASIYAKLSPAEREEIRSRP